MCSSDLMKTSTRALKKMLLEIALGSDPTAGDSKRDEKVPKSEPTKTQVPVSPSLESPSHQLSEKMPPIADAEFVPATKAELARAMHEIGMCIEDDQEAIEGFYTELKNLYSKFTGMEIG